MVFKKAASAPAFAKYILKRLAAKAFPRGAAMMEFPAYPKPRYGWGAPPHPVLHRLLDQERATYQSYLESFLEFKDDFLNIPRKAPSDSTTPMWDNEMMPALDAIALYGMLCLKRPRRYLEIGAGHSTRFARRAISDHKLPTSIICIDPSPGVPVAAVADHFIQSVLEEADLSIFDELLPGDVLFIDSSHRVLMNSDVTILFLDILPQLKPGVVVHFHDIHLPFDYPPDWARRYYSEQYLLATCLLAGKRLSTLLANAFITHDAQLLQVLSPIWSAPHMKDVSAYGASLWTVVR